MYDKNNHINSLLFNAGFDRQETTVYVSLLWLGPSTVSAVSTHSGIDRMTTFRTLGRLLGKKVIDTILIGKRTHYVPKNPQSIIEFLESKKLRIEEQQKHLETNITALSSLYQHGGVRPIIIHIEGDVGFRMIYQRVLDEMKQSKDKVYRIYSPIHASLYTHIEFYYPQYFTLKKKLGLFSRTISCSAHAIPPERLHHMFYQEDNTTINERRFIPASYLFHTYQYILDTTVIYFSLEDDYCLGTIITHALFCDSQKKIFDYIWTHAAKTR